MRVQTQGPAPVWQGFVSGGGGGGAHEQSCTLAGQGPSWVSDYKEPRPGRLPGGPRTLASPANREQLDLILLKMLCN